MNAFLILRDVGSQGCEQNFFLIVNEIMCTKIGALAAPIN